jgi:hypothetical protein
MLVRQGAGLDHLLLNYPFVPAGLLLILFFGLRCILVQSDQRKSELALVVTIFTILAGTAALNIALALSRLRPLKLDLYIYKIDTLLFHAEPFYVLAPLLRSDHVLLLLLALCYGLLPIAMVAVILLYIYRRPSEFKYVLTAFLLNLLMAPVFYLLIPVCGPAYAFPNSSVPPTFVSAHSILLTAAPNGMPSVHCSSVLLITWLLRHWRRKLAIALAYAAAVLLATIVYGEHYALDLIAAIPYTALVCWLSGRLARHPVKTSRLATEELATAR